MIILGDDNINKISFENFDFRAVQSENLHEQVVHQSLGNPPPPPDPIPKQGEKHVNAAQNVLYIAWMVILGDDNINKMSFNNFDFRAVQSEKLHEQVVHQTLGNPPPPPPTQYPNSKKNT